MQGDQATQAEASGYSAFISHASEDRESAEAICQGLEAAGFPCWIAPRDVRPGEIYLEEIIRGIELSKCLVLVLSKNANQAPMVRDEVERAYNKGKPIFPIRIEEVMPSRGLELLVSTAHWIDAWRGNLSEHVAKLVLRLAEGADFTAVLPPEVQRRILWRKRARIAGILSGSAAIAILVALIMRPTSTEHPKELYSVPPSLFLTGSLVGRASPIKAGVLVQDGYDQDGAYEIFTNPVSLEIFDVSDGKPKEFFKSSPEQFSATYRAASPFDIPIPGLPMRAVSCLSYSINRINKHEALLTGWGFRVPGTPAATYGIATIGASETYPVGVKLDCAALVQDYMAKHLKDLKPITEGRTMASRGSLGAWKGDCARDRENSAVVGCSIRMNETMEEGLRQLIFGFSPNSQPFAFDPSSLLKNGEPSGAAYSRNDSRIFLPNLGSTVYASWEYQDGSKSDVKSIRVTAGGSRPTAVPLHADNSDAPNAYVAFDPHWLPRWGIIVVDPSVSQLQWSRDGRGFTRMDGKAGAFFTILTPSAFGITEPMPPPVEQAKDLWLKSVTATGQSRVERYPVDLWRIARDALRDSLVPETIISCSATDDPYIKHSTNGALKVLCRFRYSPDSKAPPTVLFQKIWWGLTQEGLRDLDDFRPRLASFSAFLGNWRECFIGSCDRGVLALSEDATTVLFRFRYWDGKETDIVSVPVN
jgi:hypothetical protein